VLKFLIYGYYCINVCFMSNKDQSINQPWDTSGLPLLITETSLNDVIFSF